MTLDFETRLALKQAVSDKRRERVRKQMLDEGFEWDQAVPVLHGLGELPAGRLCACGCGRVLPASRVAARRMYATKWCRERIYRGRPLWEWPVRECLKCGEPFRAARDDHRFCSAFCQRSTYKAARRVQEAERKRRYRAAQINGREAA